MFILVMNSESSGWYLPLIPRAWATAIMATTAPASCTGSWAFRRDGILAGRDIEPGNGNPYLTFLQNGRKFHPDSIGTPSQLHLISITSILYNVFLCGSLRTLRLNK